MLKLQQMCWQLTLKQTVPSFFIPLISCWMPSIHCQLQSESMDSIHHFHCIREGQKMAVSLAWQNRFPNKDYIGISRICKHWQIDWHNLVFVWGGSAEMYRDMPRRITDVHLNINFNCQDQDLRGNVLCMQNQSWYLGSTDIIKQLINFLRADQKINPMINRSTSVLRRRDSHFVLWNNVIQVFWKGTIKWSLIPVASTSTRCKWLPSKVSLLVCSLVPRLLFTEQENSLVNCLYRFGSNILTSLWRHVNRIVYSKML